MFGGEELIKDSLEYVVFERHLSDEYGAWRIHGKIVPAWQPSTPVVSRTFRRPHVKPEDYELKEAAERRERELEGEDVDEQIEKKQKRRDVLTSTKERQSSPGQIRPEIA